MKKYFSILLLLFPLFSSAAVPALHGRINDYAHLLSAQKKRELENFLERNERQTSNQIVFLSVHSLGGETIESYSMAVAEAWKIGQKGNDNGVILLVAKDDRQMRIEVGRGLEPYLTDLNCGRIIRDIITPSFKQGDFERGIAEGLKAIVSTANGNTADVMRYDVQHEDDTVKAPEEINWAAFVIGIIMAFTFSILGISMGGCVSYLVLFSVAVLVFGFSVPLVDTVGGLICSAVYFIAAVILKRFFGGKWEPTSRGSGGGPGHFPGSFGGSSGFSGGGFSSGSSFSGGGGSFGGGGASGRW